MANEKGSAKAQAIARRVATQLMKTVHADASVVGGAVRARAKVSPLTPFALQLLPEIDLTHSPRRRGMASVCAHRTADNQAAPQARKGEVTAYLPGNARRLSTRDGRSDGARDGRNLRLILRFTFRLTFPQPR